MRPSFDTGQVDPKTLPRDPETLQRMLVDVTAQLDRSERLLRQLLEAKIGRKSEQGSREQLALFAAELGMSVPDGESMEDDSYPEDPPPNITASGTATGKPRGRASSIHCCRAVGLSPVKGFPGSL